jgi:hypothetical protein
MKEMREVERVVAEGVRCTCECKKKHVWVESVTVKSYDQIGSASIAFLAIERALTNCGRFTEREVLVPPGIRFNSC